MKFGKFIMPILVGVLIVLVLFIFVMSSMDAIESNELSQNVTGMVLSIGGVERISGRQFAELNSMIRKIAHFGMYFTLSLSIHFVLGSIKVRGKVAGIVTAITCVLVAFADEMNQSFVAGRSAQLEDLFFDVAGVLFGMLLYVFFSRWFNNTEQKLGSE